MEQTGGDDLLAILFGDTPLPDGKDARSHCHSLPTLYPDEFAFVEDGIASLLPGTDLQTRVERPRRLLSVTLDEDLRRLFANLPREAFPEDGRLTLSTDRDLVKAAIRRARAQDESWPDVHLLWDLHPFVEWLTYKLLVAFQRRQAPVLRLPGTLPKDESLFLMQGEVPNRKGQPVIHDWFAVRYAGRQFVEIVTMDKFLAATQLASRTHPNTGAFEISVGLQSLLPEAVGKALDHMSIRRQEFTSKLRTRLDEELNALKLLRDRHSRQLEVQFPDGSSLAGALRSRKDERRRAIDRIFTDYQSWVEETLTTEDQPFLRVAAVVVG